jgi:prepilin peptidase CpaA
MDINHRGDWGTLKMEFLLPGAVGILLLAAAISDLRSRTISNKLNLAIALAALPMWFVGGLSLWPDAMMQVAAAFGVFLLFFALFAFGAMGGGDVKMIAAMMLWVPLSLMLPALIVMAIAGGILSAVMLIKAKANRDKAQMEVPYGVAIAAAGLWVLHKHYLNHFDITALA